MQFNPGINGVEVTSDWTVGSAMTHRGIGNGKEYEDKGEVIQIITSKSLNTTYWSSLSDRPGIPENCNHVSRILDEKDDSTELTITQDNNPTRGSAVHSEKLGDGPCVTNVVHNVVDSIAEPRIAPPGRLPTELQLRCLSNTAVDWNPVICRSNCLA